MHSEQCLIRGDTLCGAIDEELSAAQCIANISVQSI